MPSIFPNVAAGGIPSTSPSAANSYTFGDDFTSTCNETALPEDCSARIMPSQINAIVSEIKCFTETLTPTGTWNCGDLCNMGTAFEGWESTHKLPDGETITGTGTLQDPFKVSGPGAADAICADNAAATTIAACVRSANAPNALTLGSDGKLVVTPQNVVAGICATDAAADALAACLISSQEPNALNVGPDGRLMVAPADVAASLCGDAASRNALVDCVRSAEAPNIIAIGADGGLIVRPTDTANAICASGAAANTLANCLRSGETPNVLGIGGDGRLIVRPIDVVGGICGTPAARNALAGCLISTDAGNGLTQGLDGGLFVGAGASGFKMADDGVFRVGATVALHTVRRDVGFGGTVSGADLRLWQEADGNDTGPSNPVPRPPVQQGTWKLVADQASNLGAAGAVTYWERIA